MNEDKKKEITSELLQKIVAVVLSAVCFMAFVCYMMTLFFPDKFSLAVVGNTAMEKLTNIIIVSCILIFGLWELRSTFMYNSYVTNDGIGQTDGFRHLFVRWDDIASYRMENTFNRYGQRAEPVLLDANGRVLMKPMAPMFKNTRSGDEARARFWQYVTDRIDRMKYPLSRETPSPRPPDAQSE